VPTFRAFGWSDSGPVRKANEDAFVSEEELGLFVVADGMGGHAAGEVASRLAVDAISSFIRRSHAETEFSWPYGIDPALSLNSNRLRTAIHLANRRVFRAAESHDDYTGMGTTVVSILALDHHVSIGHVGDSRLYLLRDGVLTLLTRDDSWAATMLGQPLFSDPVLMANHPMRNVLTNVLGVRDQTDVHLQERTLAPHDRFLLCTDGLHGCVADSVLHQILREHEAVDAAAQALVAAALTRGARDNVTAVVAAVEAL
jgi:protein phosphatase